MTRWIEFDETHGKFCPNLTKWYSNRITQSVGNQEHYSNEAVWCRRFDQHRGNAGVHSGAVATESPRHCFAEFEEAAYNKYGGDDVQRNRDGVIWSSEIDWFPMEEISTGFSCENKLDDGQRYRYWSIIAFVWKRQAYRKQRDTRGQGTLSQCTANRRWCKGGRAIALVRMRIQINIGKMCVPIRRRPWISYTRRRSIPLSDTKQKSGWLWNLAHLLVHCDHWSTWVHPTPHWQKCRRWGGAEEWCYKWQRISGFWLSYDCSSVTVPVGSRNTWRGWPLEALISAGWCHQTVSNNIHTIQDTTHVAADVEWMLELRESRRHDRCLHVSRGSKKGGFLWFSLILTVRFYVSSRAMPKLLRL